MHEELKSRLKTQYNIIASGFTAEQGGLLTSIIPGNSLSKYYFFQQPLTAPNRAAWEKDGGWVEPYSMGLGRYIRQSGYNDVPFDDPEKFDGVPNLRPDSSRQAFDFLESTTKRICVVSGLKGIGKSSFLKELESTGKLTNVLRFDLNHNREFWFSEICDLLQINTTNQDLLHLDNNQTNELIGKIIDRLQRVPVVNLVFKNLHLLMEEGGEIQATSRFAGFIRRTLLLSRKHVNIRFWLLTQQQIDFTNIELEDFAMEVQLRPLSEEQTTKLVSYKYAIALPKMVLTDQKYSDSILSYTEKIQNLTGGHPGIIKLFAKFEYLPLEDIVSDPLLVMQFREEKARYFQKWLLFTNEEEIVLRFLSLIPEQEAVELDALREFQPDPNRIIASLKRKFFLEVVRSEKTPTRTYQIPSLLREYLLENMSSDLQAILKNRVQRYLQNRLDP
ncbi:MAG: hypothetical protein ACKV1O_18245 [Saprospiraceae bacterium]